MDILEWIRRNYSAVIERDPSFPEVMHPPVFSILRIIIVTMLVYSSVDCLQCITL